MKILYLGEDGTNSTSRHRAESLKRIGYTVVLANPKSALSGFNKIPFFNIIQYRTGYRLIQRYVFAWLVQVLDDVDDFDIIWINGGELFGVECMKLLKKSNRPIILYNNDDPTGGRDGNRFNTLKDAIPYYDLCAVVRDVNIPEYRSLGAKEIVRVSMSYDEVIHQPFDDEVLIAEKFQSEVAFIGTWMKNENRDDFLLKLINLNVPVSIYGDHWQKSKKFSALSPYWRGKAIYNRDYVAGIQGAKICLGFLSKGNRDLYTRRSVEVPFIGSVFCAERTVEHQKMYGDHQEAVFWSSPEECADLCTELMAKPKVRNEIRLAGMRRVRELKAGNEDVAKLILSSVKY